MNKKMLTSIATLCMIATSVANAAVTKEQCARSDKTVWVENVVNFDSSKGACVPKNACKSDNFKKNFCITVFKDIQFESLDDVHTAINTYVKMQLKWTAGCTKFLDFDVNNVTGQDYIGCISNGKYKTFEIDDTNEHDPRIFVPDFRKALCIASGGQYTDNKCNNIPQNICSSINGNYDSNIPTCFMTAIKEEPLQRANAAEAALEAMTNHQLGF